MIERLSLIADRVAFTSFAPRSAAQCSMGGTQMHSISATQIFAVKVLTSVVHSLVSCRIYRKAAYAVLDASQKT